MGKWSILELDFKVSRNFISENFSVGLLINLGLTTATSLPCMEPGVEFVASSK